MKINIFKTFSDRNLWKNNRASAVFPCYLNSNNDQVISFQNYWSWKNKINDVHLILRINDEHNKKIQIKKIKVKNHNSLSIKKIFKINEFKGLIECQFISKKNLRFPYPAIVCFYENKNNCISVVHSAGRIQNITEKKTLQEYEESNFLCKLDDDLEPFLHFFNGLKKNKFKSVQIKIFSFNNKLLVKKNIHLDLSKLYNSKILFLSDIFAKNQLKKLRNKNFFIRVKRKVFGVFGRIVVGNYHNKADAFFTTHSLSVYDNKNYSDLVKSSDIYKSNTFLPISNKKPLKLTSVCYPINQTFSAAFNIKSTKIENTKFRQHPKKLKIASSNKSKVFKISLTKNESKLIYTKNNLPGRIYVSHNYSLKNSKHPTDIGTAFHNIHTPAKTNHWGQGVCKKNFNVTFFVRNFSHLKESTPKAKCQIDIFNNNKKTTKNFSIEGESYKTKLIKNLNVNLKSNYFSWKIKSNQKNLDVIWVCHNNSTGEICGDHSF